MAEVITLTQRCLQLIGRANSVTAGSSLEHIMLIAAGDEHATLPLKVPSAASEPARGIQRTLDQFRERLEAWHSRLAPHMRIAMQRHLTRMLDDEDELEGVLPSLRSFDDLLAFLSTVPWSKAPALGLTRAGKFQVAWHVGQGNGKANLVVVFLGDSMARWYRVDNRAADRVRHATGIDPVADLWSSAGNACKEWMIA